jgi:hypothetical protein
LPPTPRANADLTGGGDDRGNIDEISTAAV